MRRISTLPSVNREMMLEGDGVAVMDGLAVTLAVMEGARPGVPVLDGLEVGDAVPEGVWEPDGVLLGEGVPVREEEGVAATAPWGAKTRERKWVLSGENAMTRVLSVVVLKAITRDWPAVYSTKWAPSQRPASAAGAGREGMGRNEV